MTSRVGWTAMSPDFCSLVATAESSVVATLRESLGAVTAHDLWAIDADRLHARSKDIVLSVISSK